MIVLDENKAHNISDQYYIKYNYLIINSDVELVNIRNINFFNPFPKVFINNKFIGCYFEILDLL